MESRTFEGRRGPKKRQPIFRYRLTKEIGALPGCRLAAASSTFAGLLQYTVSVDAAKPRHETKAPARRAGPERLGRWLARRLRGHRTKSSRVEA
jgi:hypothetical protein